jgi:rare lipoprotein A
MKEVVMVQSNDVRGEKNTNRPAPFFLRWVLRIFAQTLFTLFSTIKFYELMYRTTIFALLWFVAPLWATAQEEGLANIYQDAFHGKETASEERYDKNALTGAHKTLPYGTKVKVTNLENGKTVTVRINDRGAFGKGIVIDLSRKAAETLGMPAEGRTKVRLEVLAENDQPVAVDEKGNRTDKAKEPVKPAKEPVKPAKGNDRPETENPEIMRPGGLFKISVLSIEKKDWGVQVANFSTYESMMVYVSSLQDKWFKNVLVLMGGTEKDPQYKVVLGPFPDEATAQSYQANIKKKHNMDGFVLNLQTAK